MPETSERTPDLKQQIAGVTYRILTWGQRKVPPGFRTVLGLLFMVGGVFGFLPILGFWMFPLGLAFVAMDIPPLRRRIDRWRAKLKARAQGRKEPDDRPADTND